MITMSIFNLITLIICIAMIFIYMYKSYHVVKYYREQGRWFAWVILNILSILVIVGATEIMAEVIYL